MVRVHLSPTVTWNHFERRSNDTLRTNPNRRIGFHRIPPSRKRNIYYPLFNDDGRDSLQMMTVMDMNSNTLILDEIVLIDHEYRLEQYGEDFYLSENATWLQWNSWSLCSVTFGNGSKERTRSCPIPGACLGDGRQTSSCLESNCPICTCDWQSLPTQQNKPKPPPKARVVYMFPANGDSGSNGLYYYMKSFASYMMQNEQAGEIYDYRIVHRTESTGSTAKPCNAAENGYSITSIPENIKRDMKNDQLSSFRQYYYSMVKEMTKPCVGNAYKAIQKDVSASGGINAVFYGVQPFSNENVYQLTQGALYDFDVSLNSDFINTCNNGDIFLDSALVINDGVFGSRGAWKDKLDNKVSIDRMNLMKCVLPDASNTAPNTMTSTSPCESYFEMRSLESELTQVDNRRTCPMIPNFGKESAKELPETIARAFTASFNALPSSEPAE